MGLNRMIFIWPHHVVLHTLFVSKVMSVMSLFNLVFPANYMPSRFVLARLFRSENRCDVNRNLDFHI